MLAIRAAEASKPLVRLVAREPITEEMNGVSISVFLFYRSLNLNSPQVVPLASITFQFNMDLQPEPQEEKSLITTARSGAGIGLDTRPRSVLLVECITITFPIFPSPVT
jgi:hypothetical protein